jgi:protein-S-isoprenylcysteine O-methyltransferase Ste14
MDKTPTAPDEMSTDSKPEGRPDSPGVIMFPPFLYVGTLLAGLVLNFIWPIHLFHSVWARLGGAGLLLASGALAITAQRTMKRAGTNVLPSQPSLNIVSSGPYRFTRNPIYVANATAYLGLALILNTLWPVFLFVPMLIVLDWGIIRREERYLEAKFGDTYLAYKERVRRWI